MNLASDINQAEVLSTLTCAEATELKRFTESLLDTLGEISVLENRTALVMLPYSDTAQGSSFYLGEVLVSEAHIRLESCNTVG